MAGSFGDGSPSSGRRFHDPNAVSDMNAPSLLVDAAVMRPA
jgi:hypothetical protein